MLRYETGKVPDIVVSTFLNPSWHNRAKFFLAPTDKMMADGMTKVVDRHKFFVCRNYMMNI